MYYFAGHNIQFQRMLIKSIIIPINVWMEYGHKNWWIKSITPARISTTIFDKYIILVLHAQVLRLSPDYAIMDACIDTSLQEVMYLTVSCCLF